MGTQQSKFTKLINSVRISVLYFCHQFYQSSDIEKCLFKNEEVHWIQRLEFFMYNGLFPIYSVSFAMSINKQACPWNHLFYPIPRDSHETSNTNYTITGVPNLGYMYLYAVV